MSMGNEPPTATGPINLIERRPAEEEATFVLLPILDGPDLAHMAVFADGSYTRWMPGAF